MALALLGHDAMRRLRGALTDHGLKPRQFQTLDLLEDRGPIGQRELGDILGIHHGVLVTFLNPLEADGYISRDRDPADRRRHVVSITRSGIALLHAAAASQRAVEDALFAGLTQPQHAQFRKLLATIRNNVTKAPERLRGLTGEKRNGAADRRDPRARPGAPGRAPRGAPSHRSTAPAL
jgi:DNA-binding MarR family transcriptional regulator